MLPDVAIRPDSVRRAVERQVAGALGVVVAADAIAIEQRARLGGARDGRKINLRPRGDRQQASADQAVEPWIASSGGSVGDGAAS